MSASRSADLDAHKLWLTTRLSALLGHAEPVDPDLNLIAQGLDSLAMMRVVAELNQRGVHVPFAAFAAAPRLTDWLDLVAQAPEMGQS